MRRTIDKDFSVLATDYDNVGSDGGGKSDTGYWEGQNEKEESKGWGKYDIGLVNERKLSIDNANTQKM